MGSIASCRETYQPCDLTSLYITRVCLIHRNASRQRGRLDKAGSVIQSGNFGIYTAIELDLANRLDSPYRIIMQIDNGSLKLPRKCFAHVKENLTCQVALSRSRDMLEMFVKIYPGTATIFSRETKRFTHPFSRPPCLPPRADIIVGEK